jgi:tetratricopeptide (TPR) repeat protein/tRNA A-37 threonylcarbamoyl transferase component Bud32
VTACPADAEFDRLLADELSADDEAVLEAHVAACAACRARLDRLTGGRVPPTRPDGTLPGSDNTAYSAGVLERVAGLPAVRVRLVEQRPDSGRGAGPERPTTGTDGPTPGRRFTVLGRHAEGGLGRIHLARDEQLRRTVALKEIRPERADDPRIRQRFLTEAEITGQLEHPGVVPIYALEHDAADRPVYAMRFIQGRTLSDAITAYHRGPTALGLRELLQRFVSVCQTMAYAHSRGVLHRDLKPDNVMLGDYGETLVVDWGLAKRLDTTDDSFAVVPGEPSAGAADVPTEQPIGTVVIPAATDGAGASDQLTVAGQVMGTPAYMAPEQARGEPLNPSADVYALGGVLFTILTGKVPYQGTTAMEVLRKVAAGEPPAVAGAPRALNAIYFKAMARDPRARYATAADLARDIERWLADEPVGADREPWLVRAGRWARRRRTLVSSLGVAAVLLILTGAGVAWWQSRLAEERRFEQARREGERQFEQGRTSQRVDALLDRCEAAIASDDAIGARVAVDDAATLAESLGDDRPEERLARCHATADALGDFDRIDDLRWDTAGGKVQGGGRALREWSEAFARLGVVPGRIPPAEAAAAINASQARERLRASLDLWLVYTARENRPPLADILAAADPDPFRDAVRAAVARWDVEAVKSLAGRDEALRQPVGFAIALVSIVNLPQDRKLAVLEAAARARPRSFAVHMTAGQQFRINDPATAAERLAWFRSAVTVRPGSSVAHDSLGVALWDRGDVDGAVAEFRTAIRLDPGYATPHSNLGVALKRKGDVDGAIAEYRTAIRLDPTSAASARYNLGLALASQGDVDGEVAEYRAALSLNPKLIMARINLGVVLQSRGDVDGALTEFRTALKIDPTFGRAHYNLGNALKETGDLDGAIAAYRETERLGLKGTGPLLAEAERWKKLLPRLDAVAAGVEEPATGAEALDFSTLCRQSFVKRYAASARLYAGACAREPKYANDSYTARRHDAAQCAAMAGCGEGTDAPSVPTARAALRGQALSWLRANLNLLAHRLEPGKAADPKSVVKHLSDYLTEKELAGARPGAAREGWIPAEAAAWDAYWAAVRVLLARAREAVTSPQSGP